MIVLVKGNSRDQWDPPMVSFPYHSHIFTDSYGSGMGIVWVPLTIFGGPIIGGP